MLFKIDAEKAHSWVVRALQKSEAFPRLLSAVGRSFRVEDPRLVVSIRSLTCSNPVGLAAGFDKDAGLINVLPYFGFGYLELGTFTPLKQEGQKKPRLFRYPKERALLNSMGFNNPGIKVAADRLQRRKDRVRNVPLGVNIGKGRETPLFEAVDDYLTSFEFVFPHADYFVLNVSSPITPNLRDLQAIKPLKEITGRIMSKNRALSEKNGIPPKMIFIKVSPDLGEEFLDGVARVAVEQQVGLVATNTTVDHSSLGLRRVKREGGLSGKPLKKKSNYVIRRLYQLTRGIVPIIGVGGIFSAEDAYEKICLGASLVQVYTGWIYEGPRLIPQINRGLLRLMERDGFKRIQDAVGTRV